MDDSVDLLVSDGSLVGESPLWDARNETLLWVDIDAHRLCRYSFENRVVEELVLDGPVSVVVPRQRGGFVLAMGHQFGILECWDCGVRIVATIRDVAPNSRLNDGRCDSYGRFWAGTYMRNRGDFGGSLYQLNADYGLTTVFSGVGCSNGIAWSLDNRCMYYADSRTQRVDCFDYDAETGLVMNRRPYLHIPRAWGSPDGITVDSEGCVWVALYGGGAVHRYTPSGRLDRQIKLPTPLVTSCAFGGRIFLSYSSPAHVRRRKKRCHCKSMRGRCSRAHPASPGCRLAPFTTRTPCNGTSKESDPPFQPSARAAVERLSGPARECSPTAMSYITPQRLLESRLGPNWRHRDVGQTVFIVYNAGLFRSLGEQTRATQNEEWLYWGRPEREMLTLAGPRGARVSLLRLDLGAPLTAFILELLVAFGVREIFLLTTAGALNSTLRIGDHFIIREAWTQSCVAGSYVSQPMHSTTPAACASIALSYREVSVPVSYATSISTDIFFRGTPEIPEKKLCPNADIVEMEAASACAVCARYGLSIGIFGSITDQLESTWVACPGSDLPQCTQSLVVPATQLIRALQQRNTVSI